MLAKPSKLCYIIRVEDKPHQFFIQTVIMQNVLIHFKPSYENILIKKGISYQVVDNELDVILPDVETNSLTEDPDVLLVDYYNLDYNQVNCIEALNFVC